MRMSGHRAELSLQTERDETSPAAPSQHQMDRTSNQVRFLHRNTSEQLSLKALVLGNAASLPWGI